MKNRFLRFAFVVILSSFTTGLMAFTDGVNDGNTKAKSDKMTAAEYFAQIKNNQTSATISIEDVVRAREQSQALMNLKSSQSNYNWTSMGPNNFGGPSRSIIFDNQDATGNTLYAGSISGGLWKSTNYGNTWNIVEIEEVLNVSSICQASDGTIYVGTGVSMEPAADKLSEGSTIGKGVFKSASGDNFQLMEGTAPSNMDADFAFIQKVAVDASNNLYAATNAGLKYFDGSTWTFALAEEALQGQACDVVCFDGTSIAAVGGITYISTGSANAFVQKSGELETDLPLGDFGNIKFAIARSNSSYIYASYVDDDGTLYNAYLSTDKGNTWRVVYPGGSSVTDIFNNDGLRNNSIAVDPIDEKTVYIGGYNIYKGYEAQPTGYYDWNQVTNGAADPFPPFGDAIYLHYGVNSIVFHPNEAGHAVFCTDGGLGITKRNFTSLELLNRNYNTSAYFTVNAAKNGDIIAGSQLNGVHLIHDNGASQAQELLRGAFGGPSANTGGYNHISFINPEFFVCSDESGNFWRSEDSGENKDPSILGDVEPGDEFLSPFLMWESPNNSFSKDTVKFAALNNYSAGDEVYALSNNYDFPFKTILQENVAQGDTIEIIDLVSTRSFIAVEGEAKKGAFKGGVYMTTEMLDYTKVPEWWQIGAVEGIPSCMAYSADANYIWVGTLEGRLFRLSNIKRAYNAETADITNPGCVIAIIEIPLETTQAITSLSVDASNEEQIMFTLGNYGNSNYIYLSDNGISDTPEFFSVQGNLPLMPVYASSFEITSNGKAFVGTENGLFITDDINASSVEWTYEDNGFGNVPIFSIKQQNIDWPTVEYPINDEFSLWYPGTKNYTAIYLGTFGRGAYVTKDMVGFEEIPSLTSQTSLLNTYPNPAQQQISIEFDAQKAGQVNVLIFDLAGKLVLNKHYNVNKGQTILELDLFGLDNGSYIVRLAEGQQQYQTKVIISK
ncbi:MAG: hypothetical protein B7C24_10015 [Bacteroidetes bacterium 4572_77]|nr:MAG: hypothetical protein B7C24_10015 [Bacteroidetes bacterium 4572_77]